MSRTEGSLFQALLKHFRSRRGLSQLDLALVADISSRHLSFLETGRARPSREMVLRLGAALGMSLREQNSFLKAAGFEAEFEDWTLADGLPAPIESAIERMLAQQEPYPLTVLSRTYDVLRANASAQRLLGRFIAEPAAVGAPPNILRLLFDPRLVRPYILDWEHVARGVLVRLHRETLLTPGDEALTTLVSSLLEYPGVSAHFRELDVSRPVEPTLPFRLRRDDVELGFLTTMTIFSAAQNVALEELMIESYFPLDDATAAACKRMADGAS
jgi:transcriptional regulator with XRE-family HTH domain